MKMIALVPALLAGAVVLSVATASTNVAFAAERSMNGAAGQMPAFYDGKLFTVNMKEMPDGASGRYSRTTRASTRSMRRTIWTRNRISFL